MRRPSLAVFAALALIAVAVTAACRGGAREAEPLLSPSPIPTATSSPSVLPSDGRTSPAPSRTPGERVEPVASTAATLTGELPLVVFERTDGSTVTLPVEVPARGEYGIGLSGRYELGERGMLFYYPDGRGNSGFWMANTHVDLAIAFVPLDGRISEIHAMTAESTEITRPVEPYEFAIEAPAGWYAAHDIAPGDRVRLEFDVHAFVD